MSSLALPEALLFRRRTDNNLHVPEFKGASRRNTTVILSILAIIFGLFMEVVVFNLPYWQTRNVETIENSNYGVSQGLQRNDDGSFTVIETDEVFIDIFVPENQKLLYAQINFGDVNSSARSEDSQIGVSIWGNSCTLYLDNPNSWYIHNRRIDDNIRVEFNLKKGDKIPAFSIIVNPHFEFSFNVLRLALLCIFLLLAVIIRPGSEIYAQRYESRKSSQKALIIAITAFCTLFVLGIGLLVVGWPPHIFYSQLPKGPDYNGGHLYDGYQYQRLADALIHGHLWLDLPVSEGLRNLANPYNATARFDLIYSQGTEIYWDHAYYNGHYYSYFGVIPAVLFFVPYQLLTGKWLPTELVTIFVGAIVSIVITLVVVQFVKTYVRKTASLGAVVLAILIGNLGLFYYDKVFSGNFYAVPQITALMFMLLGIFCWLRAKRTEKRNKLSKTWLFIGSLCIAMTLGCRPQFILSSLLAFPIFWEELVKNREFFSLKARAVVNTAAVLVPFVIVFLPLMWYNFARFGSFFNFGQNYNLTGFDMTSTKWPRSLIPQQLFYYLFQPSNISGYFPFVGATDTRFVGYPNEPMLGGLFMIMPFFLVLFLAWQITKIARKNGDLNDINQADEHRRRIAGVRWTIGLLLAIAAFLVTYTASAVGIAVRYYIDFTYFDTFAVVILLFVIDAMRVLPEEKGLANSNKLELASFTDYGKLLILFITVSVLIAIVIQFFFTFSIGRWDNLQNMNPTVWQNIALWFIWL